MAKSSRNPARGIRLHGATYELNFQRQGARHFINLETADFAEAIKRAELIRSNPDLIPSDLLSTEVDRFIAYKKRQKEYTEHTARTKKVGLTLMRKALPADSTAATVRAKHLQAWHDDLISTVTSSTIHGYMMTARAFFNWARDVAKLRRNNPLDEVRIIKLKGRARDSFCSYDQRDALIQSALEDEEQDDEMPFILYCGFHAGLRFNEIVQAVPAWFDLEHRRLQLRKTPTMDFKTGEERTIPMTNEFRGFLQRYKMRAPFMIAPAVKKGKWVYRYDFRARFTAFMASRAWCRCETLHRIAGAACCVRCREPVQDFRWVTPHIMRHTFASLLVSAGESIYKVAMWLGDLVTTVQKHYGHLAPDEGGIEKAFSHRVKPAAPPVPAAPATPRAAGDRKPRRASSRRSA